MKRPLADQGVAVASAIVVKRFYNPTWRHQLHQRVQVASQCRPDEDGDQFSFDARERPVVAISFSVYSG